MLLCFLASSVFSGWIYADYANLNYVRLLWSKTKLPHALNAWNVPEFMYSPKMDQMKTLASGRASMPRYIFHAASAVTKHSFSQTFSYKSKNGAKERSLFRCRCFDCFNGFNSIGLERFEKMFGLKEKCDQDERYVWPTDLFDESANLELQSVAHNVCSNDIISFRSLLSELKIPHKVQALALFEMCCTN